MKSTSWTKSKEKEKEEPLEDDGAQDSGNPIRTTWYFWVFVVVLVTGGLTYVVWEYLESQYVLTSGRVVRPAVDVRAPAQGTVSSVHVSEGASVENGQLLLALNNDTLQSNLADKQSEYDRLKQELQSLQNTDIDPALKTKVSSARRSVMQLQSNLKNKRLQLERLHGKRGDLNEKMQGLENLYLLEAISEPEYREVETEYEEVKTQLNETKSTVSSLESELKEAKKNVQQLNESIEYHREMREQNIQKKKKLLDQKKQELEWTRKRLENLKIKAPRDGIVTNIYRNENEEVAKHETVLSLSSSRKQWIVAYVPVKKFPSLRHEQPAVIKILGDQKKTLAGTVDLRTSPHTSDESGSAIPRGQRSQSDLEYDLVPVRVNLKPSDVTLRSGMVVRIRIELDRSYFTWF